MICQTPATRISRCQQTRSGGCGDPYRRPNDLFRPPWPSPTNRRTLGGPWGLPWSGWPNPARMWPIRRPQDQGGSAPRPKPKRAPQRAEPSHQANLAPDRPQSPPSPTRRASQRPTWRPKCRSAQAIGSREPRVNDREEQRYPPSPAPNRNENPPNPRLSGMDYGKSIFKVRSQNDRKTMIRQWSAEYCSDGARTLAKRSRMPFASRSIIRQIC